VYTCRKLFQFHLVKDLRDLHVDPQSELPKVGWSLLDDTEGSDPEVVKRRIGHSQA
jgi:hypothetical protein